MSIEQWKIEIDEIKKAYDITGSNEAKHALSDVIHKLWQKIRDEENRQTTTLNKKVIDGHTVEIPRSFYFSNEQLKYVDGIIYAFDKSGELEKDGSYHWHHYAWIPNGHKFTKLCVRTLGGDYHGDRYFASTYHYKHPADWHSYQSRDLARNNYNYRPYINFILKELNLLDVIKPRR